MESQAIRLTSNLLGNHNDPSASDTMIASAFDVGNAIGRETDNCDESFTYDTNGQFEHLIDRDTAASLAFRRKKRKSKTPDGEL